LNWYPRATTKLRPTRSPRKTHPARTHLINGLGYGTAFSPAARIQQCCGELPTLFGERSVPSDACAEWDDGPASLVVTDVTARVVIYEALLGANPNLRAVSYRSGSVIPVTLAVTKLSSFSFLTGISSWYKDRTWQGSISDRRAKYLFRLCEQRSHDRCHQFLIPLEAKVIPATS
jgi:hypothetical protein